MAAAGQTLLLRVGAKTHVGKVRAENQDRMSRFTTPLGEVFIVADGVGGHRGGATAAMMAVEGLEQHLQSVNAQADTPMALQHAAQQTNAEIHRLAHAGDPAIAGMGSTVVLALVTGQRLIVGHAGDSRAYLFREERLQRLTRDHSHVQQMLDHNLLTEEEARDHPHANVINRAFGQKDELELELSEPLELQAGDGVLLCSDGLCGYVEDAEIERVIRQHEDAQKITDALIEVALAAGGQDNVTVQFLQFGAGNRNATDKLRPQTEAANAATNPRKPSRSRLSIVLLLLGVFLLGMLAMAAAGRLRAWLEGNRPAPLPAVTPAPAPPRKAAEEDQKKKEEIQPPSAQPTATPAQDQPGEKHEAVP